MKHFKRGLAVLLAVMLMVPSLPATATGTDATEPPEAVVMTEEASEENEKKTGQETPSAEPSSEETPSAEPSEEAQPEAPSAEEVPSETQFTQESPSGTPSEAETPSETASAEETPSETASAEETPSETASEEETPSETASAGETPSETASEEETPSETASVEETPSGTPSTEETEEEKPSEEETETETETESETADETETETETEGPETTVSGNDVTIPESDVPEKDVSGNSVSGNSVFADSVSMNSVSGNSVSANTVKRKEPLDEVKFNTGKHVYSVVGREDFFDHELGDACFEEDGSYTINIPEENPFFPYEVQFTYDGETTNEWFMTPEDSVEVGGHTFYVSASFDGTAITQMSLKVAGDTIVVYPEEKEFTDESGISLMSLLPLEERNLQVDLSAYTPVELTMVAVDSIFAGENTLKDTDSVIWTNQGEDDYEVSTSGDMLDLSHNTCYAPYTNWEMIVGENDQLASSNIRYNVSVKNTRSEEWLSPVVYIQDESGNRNSATVLARGYSDYDTRRLNMTVSNESLREDVQLYLGLSINPEVYEKTAFNHIKIYKGNYTSAQDAVTQTDITDIIWNRDFSVADSGYAIELYQETWITMVSFDSSGNPTGCLPILLYPWPLGYSLPFPNLYVREDGNVKYVSNGGTRTWQASYEEIYIELDSGYALDREYYLSFSGFQGNVTAAYVGQFNSITEASAAGATDIKNVLFFKGVYEGGGYIADYSKGVIFTVFADEERYCVRVSTTEGEEPEEPELSSGTTAWFNGLNDAEGNRVSSYAVDEEEDSYAEYNYLTIMVNDDADLSALAPIFSTSDGINLYAQGSSTPEVSGKSIHDFSNGPVQYTASAENGKNAKNYWLQVIKPEEGEGQLYINSFADSEAKTKEEGGVTYSTREVMLDGYHEYFHDILLANMGTEALPEFSAELDSDTLELDKYWTLKGKHELAGCTSISDYYMPGLENLAKIRLRAKSGVESGTDVSGTLTIKSAGTPLVVLTLTGTVGDPSIITKEIPGAVKYVPYGTMIQNNNKYSWNTVSYSMIGGRLPKGMTVRQNGEIYGVPQETGEFTFTVRMTNSHYDFSASERTFTLTVAENTDANVEGATDQGYTLTQRIQNVTADSNADQTLVSQGEYAEFVDIYLDGVKLEEGVDYTSESGSTRITIRSQTLRASDEAGTHTLGIEFRTQDTDTLKRAAQNYVVETDGSTKPEEGGNTGEGGTTGDGGNEDSGNQGGGNPSDSSGNQASDSGSSGESGSSAQSAGNPDAPAQQPETGTGINPEGDLPEIENGQAVLPDADDEIITYTVQEGDTLWKIAEAYYGSGRYWTEIYRLNEDVIGDPDRIYAGQVLKINLSLTVEQQPEREPDKIYYIVQKGDSLWSIAEKLYGQGRKWRRIDHAHRIRSDPQYICEGEAIIIP